jgi:hypothetical protein
MDPANDDEADEVEGSCYAFEAPGQPTLYGIGTWAEAQRYAARLGLGYEARRLYSGEVEELGLAEREDVIRLWSSLRFT